MPKFRKKPVVIEAHQWHQNGDHPDDYRDSRPGMARHDDGDRLGHYVEISGEHAKEHGWEGAVVRYFRRPDVRGDAPCSECGRTFHDHGWIDTKEDGHRVCPGDWIITGVQGERYPCKPGIFAATYEPA